MSEPRTVLTDVVPEASTCRITAEVQDELGAALPAAQLTTLTMTLYAPELADNPILNANDEVNIKNANQGTVDAAGALVVTLAPADNEILDRSKGQELHRMRLDWSWAAGVKVGRYEIDFYVRNLELVP